MAITKYKLNNGSTPKYVFDGGYFPDPDDSTMIGIGLGGGTVISSSDLMTRVKDIATRYPIPKPSGAGSDSTMTTSEIETMVNTWCTEKAV
jgi:hypothetical protein